MKAQIQRALPREAWQSVSIVETNEPLVQIFESDRIKIYRDPAIVRSRNIFVRKSLATKLLSVLNFLPSVYILILYEGWRSMEDQKKDWDLCYFSLKLSLPDLSHEELERRTALIVARPNVLANHHCGGAIDLTLGFARDSEKADMGTPAGYALVAQSGDFRKKIPMHSSFVTAEQKMYRAILREAMEKGGFVWYPGEWWHYCYGDRMWAVYQGLKECRYGPIELAV